MRAALVELNTQNILENEKDKGKNKKPLSMQ